MKTSFNAILILGLLSVGFFSCNEVRTQEQSQEQSQEKTQEYYILNDYLEGGCLKKDGTFTVNEDGVTVYRASSKSGKLVDFFADMTYKFLDGSKSGKWKCSTDKAEIQEPTDAYQSHLSEGEGIPETQPETQSQNCDWCGNTFSDDGYSIYHDEIIPGKYKDPWTAQKAYEGFGAGEFSNVGNYCRRKCAVDAYNSGERDKSFF